MTVILDADWAEISSLAGGLPDAARDEISEEIQLREEKRESEHFEVRSSITRDNINQASDLASELSGVLGQLAHCKDYPCYNTGGLPISMVEFERHQAMVARLCEMLALDRARFQRKSAREWRKQCDAHLLRRLLEIQAHHLKTRLPLQAKEKPTGVPFRAYLEKCTGFKWELDHLLKTVTREFARRRKTARGRPSDVNAKNHEL